MYLSSDAGSPVCQCRVRIDRLKAGTHTCGAFVGETGRTSPTTPAPERLKEHKEISRWGGKGEGECTRFSQGSQNWFIAATKVDFSDFSFLYETQVNLQRLCFLYWNTTFTIIRRKSFCHGPWVSGLEWAAPSYPHLPSAITDRETGSHLPS